MCDERDEDGKRRYAVGQIGETFCVSRKTIYRHLEPPNRRPTP
jgi:predicted transcriptional regulator YheO